MRMHRMIGAAALSLVCLAAAAAGARAEEGPKIAVIDMQQIILNSKKGQKAKKEWDNEIAKRKSNFQKLQEEIQSMQQELDTQSTLLSEKVAEQKREELRRKIKDAQRRASDYNEEIQRLDQKLAGNILEEVRGIVKDYAQKNNLQIVFDKESVMMLYYADGLDITKKILDLYDSKPEGKP